MKILPLWQPWATLVVYGIKGIETRPKATSWTKEKGYYLILAAKQWTFEQAALCHEEPFKSALKELGYYVHFEAGKRKIIHNLPLGKIIGSIEVKECQKIVYNNSDDFKNTYAKTEMGIIINQPEESFGDYRAGRFAWFLDNPRILETQIPFSGQQGYYQDYKGDESLLKFKQ
jgi:hypothetical protein